MIPLFRDPFRGGLSLVPRIKVVFLFFLFSWILNCWCEENTGRHFKGFYFIKSIQHAINQHKGEIDCGTQTNTTYIYMEFLFKN